MRALNVFFLIIFSNIYSQENILELDTLQIRQVVLSDNEVINSIKGILPICKRRKLIKPELKTNYELYGSCNNQTTNEITFYTLDHYLYNQYNSPIKIKIINCRENMEITFVYNSKNENTRFCFCRAVTVDLERNNGKLKIVRVAKVIID